MDPVAVVRWDYREQPPWETIQQYLTAYTPAYLTLVDDTGDDQYALCIAAKPLTQAECQEALQDAMD